MTAIKPMSSLFTPEPSTFRVAFPYAVATLSTGVIGATAAFSCASRAVQITGIFLGLFGAYGFAATVVCGIIHSGNSKAFKKNINKSLVIASGQAISTAIEQAARSALHLFVADLLQSRGARKAKPFWEHINGKI